MRSMVEGKWRDLRISPPPAYGWSPSPCFAQGGFDACNWAISGQLNCLAQGTATSTAPGAILIVAGVFASTSPSMELRCGGTVLLSSGGRRLGKEGVGTFSSRW